MAEQVGWAAAVAELKGRSSMARASAVGGVPGVTPLGDRPGTTPTTRAGSWKGTAAGRARVFAIGAFVFFTFVHVAAEARFQ